MKFLEAAKLILLLLPAIIAAIKSIEDVLPDGGKGAEKLALIREIIKGVYDKALDVTFKFDDMWPFLQPAVASLVAFFNAVGVFKKAEDK